MIKYDSFVLFFYFYCSSNIILDQILMINGLLYSKRKEKTTDSALLAISTTMKVSIGKRKFDSEEKDEIIDQSNLYIPWELMHHR